MRWHTLAISGLRRLRQEDHEFKASYVARLYQEKYKREGRAKEGGGRERRKGCREAREEASEDALRSAQYCIA